ncbi:MAG: hypothetical protein QOE61_3223 [Micromonosporaceae bacterium]|jgi:hypothetical protein|nr:hypothetical protein [Micromonosporaceae bacterium]
MLHSLGPIPAAAIAAWKAMDRRWRELSSAFLSDEVFGEWAMERLS